MRNIYSKTLLRALPIILLLMVVLVNTFASLHPSGIGATGTGFALYHDSYYGYSIVYPKDWKITRGSSHINVFVAPSSLSEKSRPRSVMVYW